MLYPLEKPIKLKERVLEKLEIREKLKVKDIYDLNLSSDLTTKDFIEILSSLSNESALVLQELEIEDFIKLSEIMGKLLTPTE